MTVNLTGSLCFDSSVHVETLKNGRMLCFVEISSFIEKYLPGVDTKKYMFSKNISIDRNGPLSEIFSNSEIDGINAFRTLKKQVEWMCGRLAVKHLLVSRNILPLAMPDIEVGYEPHGAPFLKAAPDLPVSISHSGNLAVCSSDKKAGKSPGVDLEIMEDRDMKYILEVAFSNEEKHEAEKASDKEIYRIWTMKEAFLKYIKEGFNENLKVCEIKGSTVVHRGVARDELTSESYVVNGEYMLSLVF